MHLRVETMPDDPNTQAFLYGPLVLAGDLGNEGLTEQMTVGPNAPRMRSMPIDVPSFRAAGADPASWIRPAGAPLAFRTTGQQRDVTLAPLNRFLASDTRFTGRFRNQPRIILTH